MTPAYWILLALSLAAVAVAGVLVYKGVKARGGSDMDPEKQAKRKARRAARREKATQVGRGVRKGLANLDDQERAAIKALLLETAEDVKDVIVLLPQIAAMVASKTPDLAVLSKALVEVQEAGEDLIALVKMVREGIAD